MKILGKKDIEKIQKMDFIEDQENYILKHCSNAKTTSTMYGHDYTLDCKLTNRLCQVFMERICNRKLKKIFKLEKYEG